MPLRGAGKACDIAGIKADDLDIIAQGFLRFFGDGEGDKAIGAGGKRKDCTKQNRNKPHQYVSHATLACS
jgi:hypothetical protein